MQNCSIPERSRFTALFFTGAVIVLAMGWSKLVSLGGAVITDPFHIGEYFATFASLYCNRESYNYLTIHGALDYIPALLSYKIYGQDHYFFGTILIYALIDILSDLLLYILIAAIVIKSHIHYKKAAIIVAVIVVPVLVNYRDVLLLVSLLLYFSCQRVLSPLKRKIIELILGITLTLNMFWSFDRGIAGILSIGFACLMMFYQKKIYLNTFIGLLLAILTLHFYSDNFGLQHYYENIIFLMNTSSQWSYGWKLMPVIHSIALSSLCFCALAALAKSIIRKRVFLDEGMANTVLLGILTVIFLKIGLNRADLSHIYWGMWPASLAFLYAQHTGKPSTVPIKNSSLFKQNREFPGGTNGYVNLIFIIIFALLITPAIIPLPPGNRHLIKQTICPPENEEMVSGGIKWIAGELKNAGASCVFDLANHGVINGLVALPACVRFVYPVYANKGYENEMIETLRNKKPPVIVYSSTDWSFSIDDRDMHARFPVLKSYLDQVYPYETCKYGYCLRYLSGVNHNRTMSR